MAAGNDMLARSRLGRACLVPSGVRLGAAPETQWLSTFFSEGGKGGLDLLASCRGRSWHTRTVALRGSGDAASTFPLAPANGWLRGCWPTLCLSDELE